MKNKAQVSLEYMVILGITLAILVAVLLVVNNMLNSSTQQIGASSTYSAMESVREGADFIYVTGHPSKIQKSVYIPDGVQTKIKERLILFQFSVSGAGQNSHTDIYAVSKGNLTGQICSGLCHEGDYKLVFESVGPVSGYDVNITRTT